jgi:hypothetical protein
MAYYLIVNCGYTARLVKYVGKMAVKPYFIWDNMWGKGLYCSELTKDIAELIKMFGGDLTSGTICFKYDNPDEFNIIEVIKMLQEFDHCACFFIDDVYGAEDEEDERRMITNNDLYTFDKEFGEDKEYFCGTLYQCKYVEKDGMNIMFMQFDTESG